MKKIKQVLAIMAFIIAWWVLTVTITVALIPDKQNNCTLIDTAGKSHSCDINKMNTECISILFAKQNKQYEN